MTSELDFVVSKRLKHIYVIMSFMFHVFGDSALCGWRVRVGVGSANNVPLHAYLLLRYWMFTCMCTRT